MSVRIQKINELFKTELAQLIKEEMPAEFGLICVHEVETSPDLSSAKVWLGKVSEAITKKELDKINARNKFFQYRLRKKLSLKHIPELHFYQDRSYENVSRVEELLDKIKKQK